MATAQRFRRWQLDAYGSPDGLKLVEYDIPTTSLGPRDVLVRVCATTATYTDLLVLSGSYVPKFPAPVTPGYELVGTVLSTGRDVTAVAVGDRVAAMPQNGCLAEARVVPEKFCVKLSTDAKLTPPPGVCATLVLTGVHPSDSQGQRSPRGARQLTGSPAAPAAGVTAYQMLHRVAGSDRLRQPGASILVHGAAGGTGAMLVELAKLAGVTRIFGTCSARNMDAVRAAGATPIDYNADGGAWDSTVLSATGGAGVCAVFDAVGLNGYLIRGLRSLSKGGAYVLYGFTSNDSPGKFRCAPLRPSSARARRRPRGCVDCTACKRAGRMMLRRSWSSPRHPRTRTAASRRW